MAAHSLNSTLPVAAAEGVKGTVAYNVAAKDTIATVAIDKRYHNTDLTLKASYQSAGDVFILQVGCYAVSVVSHSSPALAPQMRGWVAH